ncbi:MAG TPA: DUF2158 domain-containing protein [Xanthobacteraceae bacterium]|jgi:uncharacterized protein YodC (DUF2158 family)
MIGCVVDLMGWLESGAAMAFKVGDTVQLKSGSPRMTVTVIGLTADGKEVVECAWFDGLQRQNGSFPTDALRDAPVSKQSRPL